MAKTGSRSASDKLFRRCKLQPDCIVEIADGIYIIEIKAYNELEDDVVKLKAFATQNYCDNVNKYLAGKAKTWYYRIISDIHIKRNSDFLELIRRAHFNF